MNIYEIGQDFDNYKFFVFKEDDKSNKDVWDYVNRLVEFNRYTNSPLAYYEANCITCLSI